MNATELRDGDGRGDRKRCGGGKRVWFYCAVARLAGDVGDRVVYLREIMLGDAVGGHDVDGIAERAEYDVGGVKGGAEAGADLGEIAMGVCI